MTDSQEQSEVSISAFHSHIYFDAQSIEQARELSQQAGRRFGVTVGRIHERPVGPHPDWSCQLAYAPELFGSVMSWLALHRGGLVVFTHPETGDELIDHRDRAIWMGAVRPLNLAIFEEDDG